MNARWKLAILIFLATCLNYFDRQLIGLLKPVIGQELGWSETDFSRIVTAFTSAYAIGLLIFGRFLDRIGIKWGYLLAVVAWTLASMGHALAATVAGFMVARIFLGLGEAGNFPAGMKAIAEWFPVKERGQATGFFNSGTSIGVVLALVSVPFIMNHFGWQGVFWATGVLGLFWTIGWVLFHKKHEGSSSGQHVVSEETDAENQRGTFAAVEKPDPWSSLFKQKETWAYIAGKLFIDPIFWFFLFWLPSYFSSTFRIDLTKPSLELMIIYGSTTLGSILGGFFSSQLILRGWSPVRSRKMVLCIFAIIELSILSARYITDVWTAVALISMVVAVHQAWATNIFTLVTDLFPKKNVSSVVGIGGMAGSLGGIGFPLLVGWILDKYKSTGNLTGGYNLIFIFCGFAYSITWLIIHLLTRKSHRIVSTVE
jgi:ACS family hexuronate transporter-like MFS transporter